MKRKVIIFLTVVLLFVSAIPCAFASQSLLPSLPKHNYYQAWVMKESSGNIVLLVGNNAAYTSGDKLYIPHNDKYQIIDNRWELVFSSTDPTTYAGYVNQCYYDSTGQYASNSLELFHKNILVTIEDVSPIYDKFTDQITVKSVVSVLVVGVTAVVGLVFMWWGARKLVRGVMTAFKKGKVKL